MKLRLYYHIADLPGWEKQTREQIRKIQRSGLWDNLEEINFQLHYSPQSFDTFLEWAVTQGSNEINVSWRRWTDSKPPLGELYSMRELADDAQRDEYTYGVLRYHNKGITKMGTSAESCARGWQDYYDYWCVEQWRLCAQALEAGYNTVGANWHENPGALAQGHWSGNIWWARSDYLARLPMPLINDQSSEFGGYSPRHDAELWIGMDRGCQDRLELHHYEHGCVYNVDPPRNYRLGRSLP